MNPGKTRKKHQNDFFRRRLPSLTESLSGWLRLSEQVSDTLTDTVTDSDTPALQHETLGQRWFDVGPTS